MNEQPIDEPDDIVNRLVRIETRLVKLMLALNLDPKTGEKVQPRKQKRHKQPPHERNAYDLY